MIEKYWPFLRPWWFSFLVVVGMIAAVVELIIRRDASDAPTTSLWFAIPLLVIGIAPLLWWRRYRFAAPAAFFVINALESFVDGRLVTFTAATFFGVLAAVFLFGILEDRRQAIAGLGIALAAGGVVTTNHPTEGWGDFVGVALLISVVWLAAFAQPSVG